MNKEKLWQRSRQRIRFQNEDMDFYFTWILAHQSEGGTALGECFYAASDIKDGDPESLAYGMGRTCPSRRVSGHTRAGKRTSGKRARSILARLDLLSDGRHLSPSTRPTAASDLAKSAVVLPTSSGSVQPAYWMKSSDTKSRANMACARRRSAALGRRSSARPSSSAISLLIA